MYRISDQQIDFILNDISARGIEMESLQQNLLDHICCIIEHDLEENGDFESFYQKTIKTFYKDALWEIEEETLQLLIFKNYYTMKKIMIISGTVSAAIMSTGIFFKFMHWPGASLFIILGIIISSLVFLPLVFTLKAKEKQSTKDKLILGIAILSGILISLAILFKVMRWPGANTMGTIFIVLMLIFYMPLYFFSGIKNPEAKINTIVTTIIIIMGCGLFLTLLNTRPYIQDNADKITNQALQESYISISEQVRTLSHTANLAEPTASETLAFQCNAACEQIETLKVQLLYATGESHTKMIDYYHMGKLDNYDVPSITLFGTLDDNEATPTYELQRLRKTLEEINSVTEKRFNNTANLIDLSDKKNLRTGLMETWETHQFYRTPFNNVLRNLTQLQINIRFIQLLDKK